MFLLYVGCNSTYGQLLAGDCHLIVKTTMLPFLGGLYFPILMGDANMLVLNTIRLCMWVVVVLMVNSSWMVIAISFLRPSCTSSWVVFIAWSSWVMLVCSFSITNQAPFQY